MIQRLGLALGPLGGIKLIFFVRRQDILTSNSQFKDMYSLATDRGLTVLSYTVVSQIWTRTNSTALVDEAVNEPSDWPG